MVSPPRSIATNDAVGGNDRDQQESLPDPNDLRRAANERFAANALDEALPIYSLAVEVARKVVPSPGAPEPDLVVHLCNRSACLYRMDMYEEARRDAAEASAMAGGRNSKALFRLAKAQIALGEYSLAMDTIGTAAMICEEQLKRERPSVHDDGDGSGGNPLLRQKQEFENLLVLALRKQKLASSAKKSDPSPVEVKSVKLEPRTPSIKEFARTSKSSDDYTPLGEGNFSTVVVGEHKVTHERFAIKIIEKEECKKLAKRQHPNVYNEVAMERRILTQHRLPGHVNIIRCYHAMQDYGCLYFLMELHREHGDLWSQVRYQGRMVGCHSSLVRTYLYEILAAVEHCHRHGVVHRDIKCENVLLSERGGHSVLIDFGTAKDLVVTDLNGPEFVGTPDFMSPEAVRESGGGEDGADFAADLWALGAMLYQLYAGVTPFESQSPYLGFLKIQRGMFARNMGVWDDDAWDLIQQLLKVDPQQRLGASCFEWIPPPKAEEAKSGNRVGSKEKKDAAKCKGKVIEHGNGYDVIRQHPFFSKHEASLLKRTNSHLKLDSHDDSIPQPIPSLQDLAIRATAHFIDNSSLDIDLEDLHPPGDNSSFDAFRLKPSDRRRVMHLLDRLHLLKEPRIYRRFFHSKQEARLGRVRTESRDVMGLTQINDKMGQARGNSEDEPHPDAQIKASKLIGNTKTWIHHITNPLFDKSTNDKCNHKDNEAQRKLYLRELKESIRLVNRVRPAVVIACGYFDKSCRKILSKVNETVPVILHDGSAFFNFWVYGAHCIAMPLRYLRGEGSTTDEQSPDKALAWFRMELEQMKTARSHGYVFVEGDAREVSSSWIAKMGKSHVLGLLGTCNGPDAVDGEKGNLKDLVKQKLTFETQHSVAKHGNDEVNAKGEETGECPDDDISASSSKSDISNAQADDHVMHVVGRAENGVRCITVHDEDLVWDTQLLL